MNNFEKSVHNEDSISSGKMTLYIVIIFIGLFAWGWSIFDTGSSGSNISAYQWITEEGTLLRDAEEVVIEQIGEENNMGERTVVSIETKIDELWISYNASENFTANMTRGGIKSDMRDVFSSLNSDILGEFDSITVLARLPLVSPEGHESDESVMTVTLATEKVVEINWDNFLLDNLSYVASVYNVHPAIQ